MAMNVRDMHMQQTMARQAAVLQIGSDNVELEELREMKADVERRERAQAAVLERQAKRLEELDSLYKVDRLDFHLHQGRGFGFLYAGGGGVRSVMSDKGGFSR